jgi:hypothetical protein
MLWINIYKSYVDYLTPKDNWTLLPFVFLINL